MADLTALQKSEDSGSMAKQILSSLMSTQTMSSSSNSTHTSSIPFDFTASPLHKSLLSLPTPASSHLDTATPSNIEDITRVSIYILYYIYCVLYYIYIYIISMISTFFYDIDLISIISILYSILFVSVK